MSHSSSRKYTPRYSDRQSLKDRAWHQIDVSGEPLPAAFLAPNLTRDETRALAGTIASNMWVGLNRQGNAAHGYYAGRCGVPLQWLWRGKWRPGDLTDPQLAALLRWCLIAQVGLAAVFQEPNTDAAYKRIAQAHGWLSGLRVALFDEVYVRVRRNAHGTGNIKEWERDSREMEWRWLAARLPDGLDFPDRESALTFTILDERHLDSPRDDWKFSVSRNDHTTSPEGSRGQWIAANVMQGGAAWL